MDAKVGEENKQFYNLALAPEPLPEVQVRPSCGLVDDAVVGWDRPEPYALGRFVCLSVPDLLMHSYIHTSWQALADGLDLEAMDHHALSRVPFVLLLLKARTMRYMCTCVYIRVGI